jgi:hypothetical protein
MLPTLGRFVKLGSSFVYSFLHGIQKEITERTLFYGVRVNFPGDTLQHRLTLSLVFQDTEEVALVGKHEFNRDIAKQVPSLVAFDDLVILPVSVRST